MSIEDVRAFAGDDQAWAELLPLIPYPDMPLIARWGVQAMVTAWLPPVADFSAFDDGRRGVTPDVAIGGGGHELIL